MENELLGKRILMKTHSSTLVNTNERLMPQWISENVLNYASSYEFSSYNAELEIVEMMQRHENQSDILLANFRGEVNESKCEIHYVYKEHEQFYISTYPKRSTRKVLLYQNKNKKGMQGFESLLNSILISEEEYFKNSRSLISNTQKMIQDIQEMKQQNDEQKLVIKDMKKLIILEECQFAIVHIQMNERSGIMMANMMKLQSQKEEQYFCQFFLYNVAKGKFNSNDKGLKKFNRVVHLFSQKILQVERLKDFTKIIILTERHLLLLKLDFEFMNFIVLDKLTIGYRKGAKVIKFGINMVEKQQYLVILSQIHNQISLRVLKFFKIQKQSLLQLSKSNKNMKASFDETQQHFSSKAMSIRFISNVVQNSYEIDEQEDDMNHQFDNIQNNVVMSVFNNLISNKSASKKKLFQEKHKTRNRLLMTSKFDVQEKPNEQNYNLFIKEATNLVCNKKLIILWGQNQTCIHVCKIISEQEQQERASKIEEQKRRLVENKNLQKESQYKCIYSELMGNRIQEMPQSTPLYESKIEYIGKIEISLPFTSIFNVAISPNNNNLLIISKRQDFCQYAYSIFQYQLYNQLESTDPNLFVKTFKYYHKNKSTSFIVNSLVKENPIFLTGNTVHTLQNQLIEGAFSFDIHPYHLYMTVSFGFSAKVFALQGGQKLTSIYTLNIQGIKQVKYSVMGNHLCLLLSKVIKIIDAYSFSEMFLIHEKNSNFVKCGYSSNGLEFYTLSQNYVLTIYNTFNYTKIDQIKPCSLNIDYKPIAIISYLKHLHYCTVLQNGGIFIKYKKDAIVIHHELFLRYNDNEIINAIEIDEKNEIMFVGCKSGKLRAHIWPCKEHQSFQHYNELRISFSSIESLSVSKVSPFLFVGCVNGNISKINYLIEKDNNFRMQIDHTPLLNMTNVKYLSSHGPTNIQKTYNYVLTSINSINEQIPEKVKLQYKLTEVITRLNEEMNRMKANIKQELDEKSNLATQKLDLSMYHHLNRIVMTKLINQYRQESQENRKQKEAYIRTSDEQLKQLLDIQYELTKQKSLLVSDYHKAKMQIKSTHKEEVHQKMKNYDHQLQKIQNNVKYAQKKKDDKQQEIYYVAGINNCIFDEELTELRLEVQRQNKRHYELRKSCAYMQTAIRQISMRKIKEETLQFKIQLEEDEMLKKYEYNENIMFSLREEINQAETKVDKVQRQSSVIKSNAQFKKIARLDEMNDACSYKLWLKQKKQLELSELAEYLRQIEETIEQKSSQLVNLIGSRNKKMEVITQMKEEQTDKKTNIRKIKLHVLDSQNGIKRINHQDYKTIASQKRQRNTHRNRSQEAVVGDDKSKKPSLFKRATTSRQFQKTKHINSLNNIIDKSTNFLKTNLKIHHRKINKFGKQNGQLLNEYEKLKYQNKEFISSQIENKLAIEKIIGELGLQNNQAELRAEKNPFVRLTKTNFQKYVKNRQRNAYALKYKTAVSTPVCREQF